MSASSTFSRGVLFTLKGDARNLSFVGVAVLMGPFRFSHVRIRSMAVELPEHEVTSAEFEDRLAPLYQRLKIPFGTLEKLSGIKARRLWAREVMPSHVATAAARKAIDTAGITASDIGVVINCSVARDYFEPSTACLVHGALKLPETTMAFDITNACIGFSNGLLQAATMIESGIVKVALVTSGETVTALVDAALKALSENQTMQRDELLKTLPTLTLGSGAVAYVLTHDSLAPQSPSLMGAVARSSTEFSDLCAGNADYQISDLKLENPMMSTDSAKLMAAAAKLGGRMFKEFSEAFGWTREQVNHVFCHQVGRQVNDAFYEEMGLDITKEFTIYKRLGNLVSAALPAALAIGSAEKNIQRGDKVLLTAYGSGLNSIFLGLVW